MSKKSTSKTAESAPIRKADIAAGKLILRKRDASGAVLPGKQRVNIYLDSSVIAHFKSLAGARGYQTLINEALKNAIQSAGIETTIRHAIQQELKAYKVSRS